MSAGTGYSSSEFLQPLPILPPTDLSTIFCHALFANSPIYGCFSSLVRSWRLCPPALVLFSVHVCWPISFLVPSSWIWGPRERVKPVYPITYFLKLTGREKRPCLQCQRRLSRACGTLGVSARAAAVLSTAKRSVKVPAFSQPLSVWGLRHW